MCLEFKAELDNFLANHLSTHGDPGNGYTSYLSPLMYELFIKLMAAKVQIEIVDKVVSAYYFSISIDSTPDIGHICQFSFILRYVNNDVPLVERFLYILEKLGHKS